MKIAIATLLFSFGALAACGGSSSNNTIDSPPSAVQPVSCTGITPAATFTVVLNGTMFAFSPSSANVHVNDVVRFMTTSSHPVSSGPVGSPDGKVSTTGDNCLKFTQAGTFPFFCNVHLFPGTLTVQ